MPGQGKFAALDPNAATFKEENYISDQEVSSNFMISVFLCFQSHVRSPRKQNESVIFDLYEELQSLTSLACRCADWLKHKGILLRQ